MPQVEISPAAWADLLDIWLYISSENLAVAERLYARIEALLGRLEQFPPAGRVRREFRGNYRSYPVGNYIVYYTVRGSRVRVVRVLHAARDVSQIFQLRRRR